ncbi:MAG: efflux RND transporter periplasmic adaptor subunit [Tepidisphaerales bacterium]
MRIISTLIGLLLLAALSGGVWVLRFRPQWIEPKPAAEADEEPHDTVVPVHVANIARATMHRYVEAFGTVEPSPSRAGRMAGTADVASPVAGVVAEVLCEAGQKVAKGAPLLQLDDRLAKAAEDQATATLASAKASLAKLKATPRPAQLEIVRLAVEKAKAAVDFAQKTFERLKGLASREGTSQKSLEAAEQDLRASRIDLVVAEQQYELLKTSPTPEELADETAKVAGAEAALAAARTQRGMLRLVSPLDATVVAVTVHPGESVDVTRVLVDLVALDRLVVNASVPAEELASLSAGMSVQVLAARADGAKTADPPYEGKLFFIGPEVDRKTNTAPVGIDVAAGFPIRPGQTVRVRIMAQEHKDVLVVPRESIAQNDNGDNVIAVVEGDQATHKMVRVGLREGNLVEIDADDLKEGISVVTAGSHALPQATKVKIIEP